MMIKKKKHDLCPRMERFCSTEVESKREISTEGRPDVSVPTAGIEMMHLKLC